MVKRGAVSRRLAFAAGGLALLAAACVPVPPPPPPPPPPGPVPADGAVPANSPTPVVNQAFITTTFDGTNNVVIDHPWDISFTPDGATGLFTERFGRISQFDPVTGAAKVIGSLAGVQQSGESGLLGMAIDPAFGTNHFIYVCASEGTNQLHRLTVNLAAAAGAGLSGDTTLLTGMPQNSFHDGCRVRFQPQTTPPALWITMGDAGSGPGPQDLTSFAGKILRVEVDTGTLQAYPGNPFIGSASATTKLIYTYGHRNPQGMTFNPNLTTDGNANGPLWPYNAEHGPTINDEVNKLVAGGNAGWNPNTGGNYDQSHSMTDFSLGSNVFGPVWRSGDGFTFAPSGTTFLQNVGTADWRSWNGALAVVFLKDSKMRIMSVNAQGAVTAVAPVLALGKRERSAVELIDGTTAAVGALYVSTDMGQPNDAIWKVVPS